MLSIIVILLGGFKRSLRWVWSWLGLLMLRDEFSWRHGFEYPFVCACVCVCATDLSLGQDVGVCDRVRHVHDHRRAKHIILGKGGCMCVYVRACVWAGALMRAWLIG